jgi:hypothetical protein
MTEKELLMQKKKELENLISGDLASVKVGDYETYNSVRFKLDMVGMGVEAIHRMEEINNIVYQIEEREKTVAMPKEEL